MLIFFIFVSVFPSWHGLDKETVPCELGWRVFFFSCFVSYLDLLTLMSNLQYSIWSPCLICTFHSWHSFYYLMPFLSWINLLNVTLREVIGPKDIEYICGCQSVWMNVQLLWLLISLKCDDICKVQICEFTFRPVNYHEYNMKYFLLAQLLWIESFVTSVFQLTVAWKNINNCT